MSIHIKKSCKACNDAVMSGLDVSGSAEAIMYIKKAIDALALDASDGDYSEEGQRARDAIANLSVILLDLSPEK